MTTVYAYNVSAEPTWNPKQHLPMDPIITKRPPPVAVVTPHSHFLPVSSQSAEPPADVMVIMNKDDSLLVGGPQLHKNQRQSLPQPQPPSPTVSSPTTAASPGGPNKETKPGPSQEITWLFFRDNQWVPFDNDNHFRIEQAFTLGGVYVDIKDRHFPDLKCVRVFPTRFYLSYLGMKYRISCVLQK
ncbi:hypothetical protein BC938DRAFT_473698 [Jimgerdemannia flammicorona]|uniref:WWE domain-containing protein n=1 Tax=Jimgerdemannia flammicorona TaxID=994334 RepID=A0A433Q3L5_9FUNG|nr:hypothetical protein BC938DRAFT_473698 [Jimgerdemannia flammicorona]